MRLARVGDERRRVARAPRRLAPRDGAPGDALGRLDHRAHGMACARAEIEREAVAALEQMRQRQHVRVGQVLDMDIVADGGAVGRRIVGAEDVDGGAPPERGLQHERDEVGLGLVLLADLALGIGAGGVEIAQRRVAQAPRGPEPVQHALDHQLRFAIGVDRALRRVLGDRHLVRQAIGRAGRGKDDMPHARLAHRLEQRQAVGDVVAEIKRGLLHRLADIGEGREMHDRGDLVPAHGLGEERAVGEVAHDERPPAHGCAVAAAEIVVADGLIAGAGQRLGGVAADIAGAAGNEDLRRHCDPLDGGITAERVPGFPLRRRCGRGKFWPGRA